MTTYNKSTYEDIIDELADEFDSPDELGIVKGPKFILNACQRICERIPIKTQRELRLIVGQDDYEFADSTVPTTGTGTVSVGANKSVTGDTSAGTGTITTDGIDVTGVATLFLTELSVGQAIVVGTEVKMVASITSDLIATLESAFDSDLSASAFSYTLTKFTKEINKGSSLVIGGVTRIVDTITDANHLTVTVAFAAVQSTQAYTIDTVVSEIPTELFNIYNCTRLEGTIERKVEIVDIGTMNLRKQQNFGIVPYSNLSKPLMIAPWRKENGRDYLKIYPSVDADKQVTLYGYLMVNPKLHHSDGKTDYIPLSSAFVPMIKDFVLMQVCNRLKRFQEAQNYENGFEQKIVRHIQNLPVKITKEMSYR